MMQPIQPPPKFEVGDIVEDEHGTVHVILDFHHSYAHKSWRYDCQNADGDRDWIFESVLSPKKIETTFTPYALWFKGLALTIKEQAALVMSTELRYPAEVSFAVVQARTRLEEAAAIMQGVMNAFVVKEKK